MSVRRHEERTHDECIGTYTSAVTVPALITTYHRRHVQIIYNHLLSSLFIELNENDVMNYEVCDVNGNDMIMIDMMDTLCVSSLERSRRQWMVVIQ